MSCLEPAELARAATEGSVPAHVHECLACRGRLDEDRALRDRLRALPAPLLGHRRRAAIAAELFARADAEAGAPPVTAPARGRIVAGAASLMVAAAAGAVLVLHAAGGPSAVAAAAPRANIEESAVTSLAAVAYVESAPPLAAPRIASGGATLVQTTGAERDTITLADGIVDVDTRAARSVDVHVGDAVVRVDDSAVRVRARSRAIISVQVMVGAAHVDAGDQHVNLERDALWLAAPSAQQRSLAAFRAAWLALRAGRNHDAIALFDQVTDPTAAEEAAYWAAVAARRAGDTRDADARFERFSRTYPHSALSPISP